MTKRREKKELIKLAHCFCFQFYLMKKTGSLLCARLYFFSRGTAICCYASPEILEIKYLVHIKDNLCLDVFMTNCKSHVK